MTTYEILVAKGEMQGIAKGEKLHLLKTIWDTHLLKMPIGNIAALVPKKSVRIRPIRPIRAPIVSPFSKVEITDELYNFK